MSGSTLFYIAVAAVAVVIILLVWVALVLEADEDLPAPGQETAKPGDEPGETAGPGRGGNQPEFRPGQGCAPIWRCASARMRTTSRPNRASHG